MRCVAVGLALLFVWSCTAPCPPAEPQKLSTFAKVSSVSQLAAGPASLSISDEAVAKAVQESRAQAAGIDREKAPVAYVRAFESALRPRIEALTGKSVEPMVFDERPTAVPMYRNLGDMIAFLNDKTIFIGDEKKGAARKEAVSMFAGKDQCTAIVIGLNAIATAKHCLAQNQEIHIGPRSDSGNPIKIDSTKFVPVKQPPGANLDMVILVHSGPIPGLVPEDLPVFASTAMIDAATEWLPVGYGGYYNDGSDSGIKRMGAVPDLDSDCSGPNVATNYDCTPGYEIVAGLPTMFSASSCPPLAGPVKQHGVCGGDSGGPVYLESNGRLYLAAMNRRIEDPLGCGCKRATNVYVRFDKQLADIRKMPGIQFGKEAFVEVDKVAQLGRRHR